MIRHPGDHACRRLRSRAKKPEPPKRRIPEGSGTDYITFPSLGQAQRARRRMPKAARVAPPARSPDTAGSGTLVRNRISSPFEEV